MGGVNLASPGWLWALLPLAAAIIALYLLKMRRREVRVPATFLWPAKTEEIRANSLFQRLKFSWLLVLQLLALAALGFALARPQIRQEGLAGKVTVYVVDASASMGATDVAPSRFDAAVAQVQSAVRGSRSGERFAVIEAGPVPRVAVPLTGDPTRAERGLAGLRRSDSEADVEEALRLASALVGDIQGARIALLSDGAFAPIQNFSRGQSEFVFQGVGETAENLAITAFGATDTPDGRMLLLSVRNFGRQAAAFESTVYADGKPFAAPSATIEPGGTWSKTISAPATGNVFEARLAPKDALAADDYAATIMATGAQLRVLLVGAEDPFLERAMLLDPRVTLDRSASLPPGADDQYDIVVFAGVEEQPVRARGVLTLGRPGTPSPVRGKESVAAGEFVSAENHPLLQGVDLEGVYFERQTKVQPAAGARILAENRAGPLVVVRESSAFRQAFLAFSPLDSDFPLQVAFPIFVANALTYLGGEPGGNLSAAPGRPLRWPATGTIRLKGPEGEVAIEPRDGTATIREIDRVGPYQLIQNRQTRNLYSTLRSDVESEIRPRASVPMAGGEARDASAPIRFNDLWRYVILGCLLLLAAEWWLFLRKS